MPVATIIAAILQLEPVVQDAIVSLVQKYKSAGTVPTPEQVAADLAQLDVDIQAFDNA